VTEARNLLDLRVTELLDELAQDTPLPGAGSVAAIVVAMSASIVTMSARLAPDWQDARAVAAQAEAIRRRAAPLAQVDAEAYGAVLTMLREPPDARPEQRDFQLGRAYSVAADLPLRIAEAAEDVAELAVAVADAVDQRYRADVAGAAILAAAAARTAAHLVTVNLAMTEDDPRPGQARKHAEAAERSAARVLDESAG
jgi:methenyltetrahydrofolate cyclohydrolase